MKNLKQLWMWFYTELPAYWSVPILLLVILLIVAGATG